MGHSPHNIGLLSLDQVSDALEGAWTVLQQCGQAHVVGLEDKRGKDYFWSLVCLPRVVP